MKGYKMPRKKNYLNNKDILNQIHLSKMSYCSYRDEELDAMQDYIVEDVSDINSDILSLAKKSKAKRLSKLLDKKDKLTDDDFTDQDVVIRVMTLEHVPLVPKKKTKAEKDATTNSFINIIDDLELDDFIVSTPEDTQTQPTKILVPTKTNFHPFFHYRIDDNKLPYIVGKSHWKGSIEEGEFQLKHGNTTDELAKMYIKLCDRYGTRSNWRGYTYNDEMRAAALMQLIQVGLKFNELKSDNPFAYYTAIITNAFTRVLLNEKKVQNIRDDILEENGLVPSWTRQQTAADAKDIEDSRNMYKAHIARVKEESARVKEESARVKEESARVKEESANK
jgi:hypothetical protein